MNKIAEKAIGSASDAVRKLNPHLFGQLPPSENPQVECARPQGKPLVEVFAAEAGKRIRQDAKPLLNKLEAEWLSVLEKEFPNYPRPRPQAKRYRLGNGIWYKPDFTASSWPAQYGTAKETAWEVKGPHAFRGGLENLKVAASLYPEVRWILVWKENGNWKQQEVLP